MFSVFFAAAYVIPQAPHIIHIVADDLGFNDVWSLQKDGSVSDNSATFTPSIMGAVRDGIALTAYHTYKVCMHEWIDCCLKQIAYDVELHNCLRPKHVQDTFYYLSFVVIYTS